VTFVGSAPSALTAFLWLSEFCTAQIDAVFEFCFLSVLNDLPDRLPQSPKPAAVYKTVVPYDTDLTFIETNPEALVQSCHQSTAKMSHWATVARHSVLAHVSPCYDHAP
jgi:hypothetical protein